MTGSSTEGGHVPVEAHGGMVGNQPVCDRCGNLWQVAEVRPDLPCCPVPLCDLCAVVHRAEVKAERAYEAAHSAARAEGADHA